MKRYTLDAKCFAFVLTALICTATMTPPAALADGPQIQQNSATQNIVLGPIIATSNAAAGADHISNLTGAVLTVTIAKNGGSFISPSGAVTEIGKGRYTLAANAIDDNTLGTLSVDVVASLANPTAAPSVSTATTGGSIAAGTYYLGYTYTTAAGQTVLSPTAAVTTTGTTSTITLTTPALPSGCTGITAYEGAAANATILALASTTNTATLTTLPSGSLPAPVTNTAVAGDPWSKDFPIVAVNPLDASLFGLTGVATPATDATAVWGAGTKTITGGTITAYTGNTPQTGDPYLLATTGAGVKIAPGQSTTASNFVAAPTVPQIAAGLPTDTTIQADAQAGAYASLNMAAPSSPVNGSIFGLEAADQVASANASLILTNLVTGAGASTQFTTKALSNVQAGTGSGTDPLTNLLTTYTTPGTGGYALGHYLTGDAFARIGAPAGASLAADIAAVKADTGGLASHQKGRFTYNPATHSLQLMLDDGVTPFGSPLTLTVDAVGNTTSR